ncbi:WD40 repeat domain-containing protein [Bradyrhizobium sp. SYSU BS000235]|uniref:WD40 repeat domain-containing protein n=1 Tax=Bradyrhizobium sp. SYSU BS000235 TaxID=3411332 RepID=UPI003C79261D
MAAAVENLRVEISRIRKVDVKHPVIAVKFLGENVAFVLGEEQVVLVTPAEHQISAAAHAGAILCAAKTADQEILTGGDDGRVVLTSASGSTRVIATDGKRRWIDAVASMGGTVFAWSAGRQVYLSTPQKEALSMEVPSTVTGLAFGPDSTLAIAHYGGVTLWSPHDPSAPEQRLEYKGSHVDVCFSPSGNFLVTRMREPAIHAWRLRDQREMPMHGYAVRVQSVDWTFGGKWLASSGSRYLVLWPFEQAENPLSGVPILLAGYRAEATVVSCHPREDIVAVGYADGLVLLIRIEDESEILIKQAGASAVSALAWNAEGNSLAIACGDGVGRIVNFAELGGATLEAPYLGTEHQPLQRTG